MTNLKEQKCEISNFTVNIEHHKIRKMREQRGPSGEKHSVNEINDQPTE